MPRPKIGQGVTTMRKRKALTAEEQSYEDKSDVPVLQPQPEHPYVTETKDITSGTLTELERIMQNYEDELRRQNMQSKERQRQEGDIPQGAKDAPEAVIVPAAEQSIRDQGYGGRPGFVVADDDGWEYPR